MSQIVLHRSGTDPDFGYRKRLDVDLAHLLGRLCAHTRTNTLVQVHVFLPVFFFYHVVILLFSEVCVDRARGEEFEQRASELEQKVSNSKVFISVCDTHLSCQMKPMCLESLK